VMTFDLLDRPERKLYWDLVPPAVRARISFVAAPGATGPQDLRPVDLLYIDSSHEREQTIEELTAWRPVLKPGSVVIFDDFDHPDYPGVRQAVDELGLGGVRRGTVLVHKVK